MSNANSIQPGTYPAKIREYFVDKTQTGIPRVNISLDVKTDPRNPNVVQRSQWSGSLASPKSKALVLKTLEICGLASPSALGAVAKGRAGGALNTNMDVLVDVVTEERETRDNPPKRYDWTYVKYINPIDGLAGKDLMAQDDWLAFVENTGLGDDYARMKDAEQSLGSQQAIPKNSQYDETNPPPSDDPIIPF